LNILTETGDVHVGIEHAIRSAPKELLLLHGWKPVNVTTATVPEH
jgi:hypothetical protein